MTPTIRKLSVLWILALSVVSPLWGHDPFDGSTRLIIRAENIEITVSMGVDAAKQFLVAGALPPRDVARMTRMGGDSAFIDVPLAMAPRLIELRLGTKTLEAKRFAVVPDESELIFTIVYPRPTSGILTVRASYFDRIDHMRIGPFAASDGNGKVFISALFSAANPVLDIPLPANDSTKPYPYTSAPSAAQRPAFSEFLKLGVEHILTGFDHLLFLCALLIGVRKIRPMLAIITAFTLAHSVTLAIAALNLVVVSSRIVEPLIAASIIVVGVENFLRRDATMDRYWMAGGFGLIHGFGFASALRETGLGQTGESIVVPLLSFNLGVEAGQLMVATAIVPLLLLLRSKPFIARYSTSAVSTLVILVSGYWLLQRIFFS